MCWEIFVKAIDMKSDSKPVICAPSLWSWRSHCWRWRGRCTWPSPACPGPSRSWTSRTSQSRCEWSAGSGRERLEWEEFMRGLEDWRTGGRYQQQLESLMAVTSFPWPWKLNDIWLKISDIRIWELFSSVCLVWVILMLVFTSRWRQTDPLTENCCSSDARLHSVCRAVTLSQRSKFCLEVQEIWRGSHPNMCNMWPESDVRLTYKYNTNLHHFSLSKLSSKHCQYCIFYVTNSRKLWWCYLKSDIIICEFHLRNSLTIYVIKLLSCIYVLSL